MKAKKSRIVVGSEWHAKLLPTERDLEILKNGLVYQMPTHCSKCKKKTKKLYGFTDRSAMCKKCFIETMEILQAKCK